MGIVVKDLSFSYKKLSIIKNFSFEAKKKEIVSSRNLIVQRILLKRYLLR